MLSRSKPKPKTSSKNAKAPISLFASVSYLKTFFSVKSPAVPFKILSLPIDSSYFCLVQTHIFYALTINKTLLSARQCRFSAATLTSPWPMTTENTTSSWTASASTRPGFEIGKRRRKITKYHWPVRPDVIFRLRFLISIPTSGRSQSDVRLVL